MGMDLFPDLPSWLPGLFIGIAIVHWLLFLYFPFAVTGAVINRHDRGHKKFKFFFISSIVSGITWIITLSGVMLS